MHGASRILGAAVLLAGCDGDAAATRDVRPENWTVRLDEIDHPFDAERLTVRGDRIEVRPGPNACLWHPDLTAAGDFRVSLGVTHLDSGLHPHGAGLTFGGRDVHDASQLYTYFLVRSDRCFLVKKRVGAKTVDVVPWTEHVAIAAEDDDGVTENHLSVEVHGPDVRFLVNGTEVHRAPRSTIPVAGLIGLRFVHDIHVAFSTPDVELIR